MSIRMITYCMNLLQQLDSLLDGGHGGYQHRALAVLFAELTPTGILGHIRQDAVEDFALVVGAASEAAGLWI